MKVAILGTGGIGLGYAAALAAAGHRPVLFSPTGDGLVPPAEAITATGVVEGQLAVSVAAGWGEALDGAEAAIIAVTGPWHRAVMEAMAPHLRTGQAVIVSAQLSASALYLADLLAARGVRVPVIAWATTLLTARRRAADRVHVSGLRQRIDTASYPAASAGEGLALCRALFGDRFDLQDDPLAILLSNLNPPVHLANMLCNLTRAERGEAWRNYGGITPAVARLIEALDAERLALARSFGLEVRDVVTHFALTHGMPPGVLADMVAQVDRRRPELAGPTTLDTRFISEDVPFGLVPLAVLGRGAGVAMPLHEAGIALMSALYGRDFDAENDLLPRLGLAGLDRAGLHRRLRGESRPA